MFLFPALITLIAAAVYTTENSLESNNEEFSYSFGYSYALAWVAVVFGLVGGVLAFVEKKEGQMVSKLKETNIYIPVF